MEINSLVDIIIIFLIINSILAVILFNITDMFNDTEDALCLGSITALSVTIIGAPFITLTFLILIIMSLYYKYFNTKWSV